MTANEPVPFDFDGFREAIEGLDAERWLTFFHPDATWTEYRNQDPPRAPHVMSGIDAIAEQVRAVCAAPLRIRISREVLGQQRFAYQLVVHLAGDRQILENVIIDHRDGRIVEQVDAEAWD